MAKLDQYDELIRLMVQQNRTDADIAYCCAVAPQTVYKYRRKHGIETARRGGAQPGADHRGWKGGRIVDKHGYILIHNPSHPHATATGYVREHRLVMENTLGRYLDPKEVVHHINSKKDDNRPENLELYSKNGQHLKDELTGKCPQWSEAGKTRISEAVRQPRPNAQGRPLSAERREKLLAGRMAWVPTQENRQRMSDAQRRRTKPTDESRHKMSEAQTGRKHSPETKEKIRQSSLGKPKSEETKAKISETKRQQDELRRSQNQQANLPVVPNLHPTETDAPPSP